ncbi:MAG: DUF4124 domain-containing protein [Deltaproteobacteria bacterium]|nr:DUF4124 domain-containing protein [Deltaproteobacteria bacterium]
MCRLTSLIIFCCIVALADVAGASAIYRWRDAAGELHFANRAEVIPDGAMEVVQPLLPARAPRTLAVAAVPVAGRSAIAPRTLDARLAGASAGVTCGVPDGRGVADAVASRLGVRQLDGLTLIVGGIPVAYNSSVMRFTVKDPDADAPGTAAITEAAIAYPVGSRCPARPPLERYAVASTRHVPSRRLCDDYRRAFAEVGVAVSRDQGVARSLREVADRFLDFAARDYTAGGRGAIVVQPAALTTRAYAQEERVPLPPWIVEAHIAQTHELGAESTDLVDELTVALEEIDSAARRAGCW